MLPTGVGEKNLEETRIFLAHTRTELDMHGVPAELRAPVCFI